MSDSKFSPPIPRHSVKVVFTSPADSADPDRVPPFHPLLEATQYDRNSKIDSGSEINAKLRDDFSPSVKILIKRRESITLIIQQYRLKGYQIKDVVYVLSNIWFQKWMKFDSSCENFEKKLNIDNWDIVDLRGGSPKDSSNADSFHLLPDLHENIDFVLLPPAAWEALLSWYSGGPAIPRVVISEVCIDSSILNFEY